MSSSREAETANEARARRILFVRRHSVMILMLSSVFGGLCGFASYLMTLHWAMGAKDGDYGVILGPLALIVLVASPWLLAALVVTGASIGFVIAAAIRRMPMPYGHCERCGYDLRGSIGCPECGAEHHQSTIDNPQSTIPP